MSQPKPLSNYEWPGFIVFCLYVIMRCAYRLFVPGGEYPLPPAHYMSMAFDAAFVILLILYGRRLLALFEEGDGRRPIVHLLLWPALVAGAVLLLIRFTDNQSWWTGHLN